MPDDIWFIMLLVWFIIEVVFNVVDVFLRWRHEL